MENQISWAVVQNQHKRKFSQKQHLRQEMTPINKIIKKEHRYTVTEPPATFLIPIIFKSKSESRCIMASTAIGANKSF